MKIVKLAKAFVLTCVSLLAASNALAQTAPKIALIDLQKVFDGYYKTKQADVQLKERVADSDKVLKGMVDDYQKANDEYRKLVESSNDQAVASEERDKRKKNAETKLLEIQEIEKSVQQFRRTTQSTIEEQKRRMRDNILKEIREQVDRKAKAATYTLVLDTAAQSINQTPIIMFSNGQNDLTDEVLTKLNETAPPGSLTAPSEKKPDQPIVPPVEPASKNEKKK